METNYDFYLTNNGNVLNVQKKCLQTVNGEFLRRVFDKEMEFLKGVLIPCEFPQGIEQVELPIWEFLWEADTEYGKALCFTRQKSGYKREYSILYGSIGVGGYYNMEIADTDLSNLFVEDERAYEYDDRDCVAELIKYANIVSLLDVYFLGETTLEERLNRYRILKNKRIKLPIQEHIEFLERRRRRPKTARKNKY